MTADNKTEFKFWTATPHVVRRANYGADVMAKLIEISNKGLRAKVQNQLQTFAKNNGLEKDLGKTFRVNEQGIVSFRASDKLGEALKKAFPKLNIKMRPDAEAKPA